MTVSTEFGALLRSARLARAMSVAEVAAALRVSPSFLRRVESGKSRLTLPNFAAIWRVLGFDANAALDALSVTVKEAPKRKRRASGSTPAGEPGPFAAFGRVLVQARLQAELTQGAVGHAVGCRRHHVTLIEGGHTLPSLELFAKLRAVLGFDATTALSRLGEAPPTEPFYAFGQVVAAARVGAELSREEVARSAGCEAGHVEEVERGAELPTVLTLARMHKRLRFSGDRALRAVCLGDGREAA